MVGLLKLFKPKSVAKTPATLQEPISEKAPKPLANNGTPGQTHSRGSMASSTPSTRSSGLMKNLKFEIMANYISQEQAKRKWVHDLSTNKEGCFIRKGQAKYATYPASLAESGSHLATAIAALNPQVSPQQNIMVTSS